MNLAVTGLGLTDFRNYTSLQWPLSSLPVVLCGPNGAGKTSVLEAISLLVPGRGLRRAAPEQLARCGGGAWQIQAQLDAPDMLGAQRVTVRTALGADGRRRWWRDGLEARRSDIGDWLAMVWLSPERDRLLAEGRDERRRFLDQLVTNFDPAHAGRLIRHDKAVRERLHLLRAGPADDVWLTALEDQIATSAVAIAAGRRELVAQLAERQPDLAPFPPARLAAVGPVEDQLATQPALLVEDWLRCVLATQRRDDAASGTTATSAARGDLAVWHLAHGMPAAQCSSGEQKALLLAILLALVELLRATRQQVPLVLLDDGAAHLDTVRLTALLDRLALAGCQYWLTGTNLPPVPDLAERAQCLAVADAQLQTVSSPTQTRIVA